MKPSAHYYSLAAQSKAVLDAMTAKDRESNPSAFAFWSEKYNMEVGMAEIMEELERDPEEDPPGKGEQKSDGQGN